MDVTLPEAPKKLLEFLQTAGVTKLNVLINNSAALWVQPLKDYSEKGWNKVMNTNLKVRDCALIF